MTKNDLLKLMIRYGLNSIGLRIAYAGNSVDTEKTGCVIEWFGYRGDVWCVDLLADISYDKELYDYYCKIVGYLSFIRYNDWENKDIRIYKCRITDL